MHLLRQGDARDPVWNAGSKGFGCLMDFLLTIRGRDDHLGRLLPHLELGHTRT